MLLCVNIIVVIINIISAMNKTVIRSQSEESLKVEEEEVLIPTPVACLGMLFIIIIIFIIIIAIINSIL